jgi:type II secretory pathway pseudopilin PulG
LRFICQNIFSIHKKALLLSDYKINQNMEFGDIIFLLLGAVVLLFSFFNNSRKRKQQQEQEEAARQRTDSQHTTYSKAESDDDWWLKPSAPSMPAGIPPKPYVRKEFQSSLDLISSYEDGDSAFQGGSESIYEKRGGRKIRRTATVHPLLQDLISDSGTEELKKGLIYREIFERKY